MEQDCANCGNSKWRDGLTKITDTCIECRYVYENGRMQPSNWKPKTQTNADRTRAMSDEELAVFLCERVVMCSGKHCPGAGLCVAGDGKANGLKKWLKQPAEVGNE